MARIELRDSGVLFNEEEHTYYLQSQGKYLSGITDMLHRQLFPHEFDGIDMNIINAAATYGTEVHKSCENFDYNWINDGTQEVQDYIQLCKDNNLTHEASEYTVTDGVSWASNIDKVYRDANDTFSLADIKTYGTLTPSKLEKARWQLSIYRYFFLLQNKKAKVDKLFVIRLRNKPKRNGEFNHISELVEVKAIPEKICKELLDCDLQGEQFVNPYDIPDAIRQKEDYIRSLVTLRERISDELDGIKSDILSQMQQQGSKTWATDTMRLTVKDSSTRTTIDTKLLKKEHPEIDFTPYQKTTKTAPSLIVKV